MFQKVAGSVRSGGFAAGAGKIPAGSRSRSGANRDSVVAVTKRPANRLAFAGLQQLTHALGRGWNLTVDGLEHLPETGPAIIAANHISFIDSPLLMFELPRRVWFFGKAEYLDSPVSSRLFPALGMIPLERGGGRAALAAMRQGLAVLDGGQLLGIYPEGTRSRDGRLYRGHTGLAWMALKAEVPIVPVGIRGTDSVQPPGARLPALRGDCTVTIGPPLPISQYHGRDGRTQRRLADDVMFEISQLSGQAYVDRYAEGSKPDAKAPATPHPTRPAGRTTPDRPRT